MQNTEKERQHYVPKFYLRNFSYENNKKEIGVFNIKNGIFVVRGKLKTQGYKPFFYGKDGRIEDALSSTENTLAPIIATIIQSQELPQLGTHKYLNLLFFSILTQLRNPLVSKEFMQSMDEFKLRLVEFAQGDESKVKHLFPKVSEDGAIKMALDNLVTGMNYCADLDCKLLINRTTIPFITSDNPVAPYNQYLKSKGYPDGGTGFGNLGLQMFFPISPISAVIFYDGWAYKVGDKRGGRLDINNENSVKQLNLLQFVSCDENIFFNEQVPEHYIRKLFEEYSKHNHSHAPVSTMFNTVDKFGKVKERDNIVMVTTKTPNINLAIENLTITKKAKNHELDNRAVQLRPHALKLR